jgi:hypothetical protein
LGGAHFSLAVKLGGAHVKGGPNFGRIRRIGPLLNDTAADQEGALLTIMCLLITSSSAAGLWQTKTRFGGDELELSMRFS